MSKILYRYAETGSIEPGHHHLATKQYPTRRPPNPNIPPHLRAEIISMYRNLSHLNPEQIRSLLIARGFTTKTGAPSISQISACLEAFKNRQRHANISGSGAHNRLKHSVTNILENDIDGGSNDKLYDYGKCHRRIVCVYLLKKLPTKTLHPCFVF